MTEALLSVGAVAAGMFVAVLLVEGALRPGYNPTYHTGSALSLGERGWVQVANFLQLGIGMFAFAIGVNQRLNSLEICETPSQTVKAISKRAPSSAFARASAHRELRRDVSPSKRCDRPRLLFELGKAHDDTQI